MRVPFRKLRNASLRRRSPKRSQFHEWRAFQDKQRRVFFCFFSFAEKEKKDCYQERIKLLRLRENLRVACAGKIAYKIFLQKLQTISLLIFIGVCECCAIPQDAENFIAMYVGSRNEFGTGCAAI